MRRIWLVLAAVLLCVEIGYGAEIEIPAEVRDAVPPEAAALLDGADGAAQEGTLWTGIGRLWRSACAYVRTALESQASGAAVLLGIVLLCSMAESCFAAADAPGFHFHRGGRGEKRHLPRWFPTETFARRRTPPVKKPIGKIRVCAAMKAPVGLLSGRAVCVSRWRGFAPTSSADFPDWQI